MPAHSSSTDISYRLRNRTPSPPGCDYCSVTTGSSTPNGLSAGQNMCCAISAHTPTALPSPTAGWLLSPTETSAFRWRDSAHGNKKRIMTLAVEEFLRPFLLHLLPRGFVRIRNFGFLANRRRAERLPLCSRLLQQSHPPAPRTASQALPIHSLWQCPLCGGTMQLVERLSAAQLLLRSPPHLSRCAT
jgi:hypothetical protein